MTIRRGRFYRRKNVWSGNSTENRIVILQILIFGFFLVILFRLFDLQILRGEEFFEKSVEQRNTKIEIPARRGEILVREKNTGKLVKLATNTTLDLIYVDPKVTPNKKIVAEKLAEILYSNEDYRQCLLDYKFCPEGSVKFIKESEENSENISSMENNENNFQKVIFPTKAEATENFSEEIFKKISKEKIDFRILRSDVTKEILQKIDDLNLSGIETLLEKKIVFVDPTKIKDSQKKLILEKIPPVLKIKKKDLLKKMKPGDVRYVKIKNKIRPEISEKISEIKEISRQNAEKSNYKTPDFFRGVVLIPEHWRYYPDKSLAAQILGFVNNENRGQYGIEEKFDRQLTGKKGVIENQNDVSGSGVVLNLNNVQPAIDGISLVLTIDRIIQKKAEEILTEKVPQFKADSGQILIAEPKTGKILAIANFPTFDPNEFGNALLLRRTTPEDSRQIFKTTPLFQKDEDNNFVESSFEEFDTAWRLQFDPEFYVYRNTLGPGVFLNRALQQVYEPGSVFKPLIMSAAIDSGEVTPSTTFYENGPIKIGDFEIHTAMDEYNGLQTMTNVLETSSNVGMAEVALKLGKKMMHHFIVEKMKFGDFTNIELAQENPGTVRPKKDWSDALLVTSSFGQGLTATPIQMLQAWLALANGGVLMQLQIVEEKIYQDGNTEIIKPKSIQRMVSVDTATTITSMLVSSVENGVAYPARIDGYKIAGKTGTSQIAGPDGKYETGEGAFITSFAGYAPASDPKFLVLVKFDRPRYGEDRTWGSTTAAPVFREMMKFLLEYENIPTEDF